jgi:hypothetical protein
MQSISEIYFKSIDIDSVESVEDNPEAVTFDILLNTIPSPHWLEEFEYLYSRSQFGLKPPIHVFGDRMRILYLPRYDEELQSFISFLSLILDRATQEARRTMEILQTDEKENVKVRFKTVLSNLELPKAGLTSTKTAADRIGVS